MAVCFWRLPSFPPGLVPSRGSTNQNVTAATDDQPCRNLNKCLKDVSYQENLAAPAMRRLGRAGLEALPRSAYADGSQRSESHFSFKIMVLTTQKRAPFT